MAPIDDILKKIESNTSLSPEELRYQIKKKQETFSGLISEEGAAYLVAKEMGVSLFGNEKRNLEIKNVIAGMRNVAIAGRIFKTSDIITFKKSNGTEGRVVNLFLGDKSGFLRVPLWNDQVKLVEDEILKLGDIVQTRGAFAQENIYGDVELSLGKYGEIFNITDEADGSDVSFPSVEELSMHISGATSRKTVIKDITEGAHEIKGSVIDVLRGNFTFYVCPECEKKVNRISENAYECSSHGEVLPKPKMVISFMLDDGTGTIRTVAFRDVAEKFSTTTASELDRLSVEDRYDIVSGNVVGKEYIVEGNIKKNTRYDRIEMIADKIEPVNLSEETERLASLLKMKLG